MAQWSRLKHFMSLKHRGIMSSDRVLKLRLFQSFAVLWIEFLWSCAWLLFLVPAVFFCLAAVGLTPGHPWIHLFWLAGFFLALIGAVFHLVVSVRGRGVPTSQQAWRRLDDESGLAHDPLSSLADRPVAPAGQVAVTTALWRYHLDRLVAGLGRIPVPCPHPPHHRGARIGGRVLVVVLAVLAIAAWHAPQDTLRARLVGAMVPDFSIFPDSPRPVLDVWIDPPSYMNRSPLVLASADGAVHRAGSHIIEVPVGGQAWIRAFGVVPQSGGLRDDADGLLTARLGDQEQILNRSGDLYATSFPYRGETVLEIQYDGEILDSWGLAPIPDTPPDVTMPHPPRPGRRLALRFDYEARDDYRVEKVWAEIRPAQPPVHSQDTETLLLIRLSQGGKPDVSGLVHRDLTPHPWAGEEVEIRLKAQDSLDQTAATPPVRLILPERVFTHPLAQNIIAERKRLIRDPATAVSVARNLEGIANQLQQSPGNQAIFLGLQHGRNQLLKPDKIDAVIGFLWDLALRLEDGSLGAAERELRAAQEALEEALAGQASLDEIDRLTQRLREALNEFLRQLSNSQTAALPDDSASTKDMVTEKSLEELINQSQDLAHLGERSAAQQLLSQLREMLENLRSDGQNGNPEASTGMMEALQRLGDTARIQKELLNRSIERQRKKNDTEENGKQTRQQEPGSQSGPFSQRIPDQSSTGRKDQEDFRDDARRQESLRRQLGDLMLDFDDRLGDIPPDLGKAERAMRDAVKALQEQSSSGNPDNALQPQSRALEALQNAGQSMANRMTQNSGMSQGGQQSRNDQMDPFGRRRADQEQLSPGDETIPDKAATSKAYEVLRELRRRAADPRRPDADRAYINRLIPKF